MERWQPRQDTGRMSVYTDCSNDRLLAVEHSLALDIGTAGTSGSNSTTHTTTTAATNTPATNVHSLSSPDQFSFDKYGPSRQQAAPAGEGGPVQQQQQQLSTPTAMSDFIAMLDASYRYEKPVEDSELFPLEDPIELQLDSVPALDADVVQQAGPQGSDNRGSISHAVDFWNLPDRRNTIAADSELSQVLSDYNMNFHAAAPSGGVKKQQRGSMSMLDGNNELFSKLYQHSGSLKVVPWESATFSDEDDEFSLPTLEPIVSPRSPKSVSASRGQFIKPSMMLSENASTAAKMATTGADKFDLVSSLDTRCYDISGTAPPSVRMRRSPPPSYQTIKPPPVAAPTVASSTHSSMGAPSVARRRRSTPNIMTIRNGSTGSSIHNKGKSRSITPMSGPDDEVKPFKCKECSKAFRRSEHLKRHIRSVHSTERPFACMFCEKKFSRSDNLSQHLKTHKKHGDF